MTAGQDDKTAFFARVREQLRYWPHTLHQIEDTLDIGLIEGKGRQIVYQALNARNLTVFAGSGLSAAYGRMGWTEWRNTHLGIVERNAGAFLDLAKASLARLVAVEEMIGYTKTAHSHRLPQYHLSRIGQSHRHAMWRWVGSMRMAVLSAEQHVGSLFEAFLLCKSDAKGFVGGEPSTMLFELANQLHDAVELHSALFLGKGAHEPFLFLHRPKFWPGAHVEDNPGAVPTAAQKVLDVLVLHHGFWRALLPYEDALVSFQRAMSRPLARNSIEEQAKRLLSSECAHALSILKAGLIQDASRKPPGLVSFELIESALSFPELDDLKRAFPGIRDEPEKYRALAPFLRQSFVGLLATTKAQNAFPPDWSRIEQLLTNRFTATGDDKDRFLTPSMRFLVGTILSLQDQPQNWLLQGSTLNPQAFAPIKHAHFTSRRSLIDEGLDPIERIISGLEVRRFLTLNYDFEIERAFLDRGFRRFPRHDPAAVRAEAPPPRPADFAADAVGSLLRDQSFARDRASDLIGFSIGDPRDEASVFHLHGRATRTDPMVIAERDYMDLYLMEDAHRETVRDGVSMAFSGSPLLFVGLGLTEDEILRPLRQFMANHDRTLGFNAVALMPADKPLEDRTQFATSAYRRYGVHTVFYGGGEVRVGPKPTDPQDKGRDSVRGNSTDHKDKVEVGVGPEPTDPKDTGLRSIDWLHRVKLLIEGLKAHVEEIEGWLKPRKFGTFRGSPLGDLMVRVGKIGPDLDGYPPDTSALMVLFGTDQIKVSDSPGAMAFLSTPNKPSLQLCIFTPVRRHPENQRSRHFSDEVGIDASRYLQTPVDLLSEVFHLLIRRAAPWSNADRRQLAALRLMLDGLQGAILTGAMNAALEGLQRGWQVWWQKWQDSPPHRVARFEHVDQGKTKVPVLFVRHPVDNVLGPANDDWAKPVTAPVTLTPKGSLDASQATRVRSFDTFIAAIVSNRTWTMANPDMGRVMFTVLAHRGLGKGTFVSAFSSNRGLSLYEAALWAPSPGPLRAKSAFLLTSIFINFSFATEIASTYDMLLDALVDAAAVIDQLAGKSRDALRTRLRRLQRLRMRSPTNRNWKRTDKKIAAFRDPITLKIANLPRLEALREVMREFSKAAGKCRSRDGLPRVLITLSSLEVLYDANRRIKNPEIEAFLVWLTGPEMAAMPVDLVFLSSEAGLGAPFSLDPGKGGEAPWRLRLDRFPLKPEGDVYIRKRLEGGRLKLDEDAPHSAQRARILIGGGLVPGTVLKRSTTNFIHVVRPFNAVGLLLDNFQILATGLWLGWDGRSAAPGSWFNNGVRRGLKRSDRLTDWLWRRAQLPGTQRLKLARRAVWASVERESLAAGWVFKQEVADPLGNRSSGSTAQEMRSWLRAIRHHLHENRFLMTILLAAAQNGIVLASDPVEGARSARRFIDATIDRVRNAGADEVDEVVIRAVLDSYRSRHRIGDPDRDTELHGLILRHLGVIGAPVQVDVLVRLPEFRDYFDRLKTDLPTSRRRFLARALTAMMHRGLVFRLSPQPRQVILERNLPDQDWPVQEKYRYVLHRVVQRHVLSRLQVGTRDAIAAGSFAPSLYAALPSPGEGLSTEGYNFIRALIVGLSQYPDIPRGDDRLRPWLFTTSQANIRIQALRLALSLARSTLSLPVFAALDGQTRTLQGQAKRGFLDTYKVRLRWLIRFAWESIHHEVTGTIKPHEAENFPHLNALYRDEIVWLYNELGVISLAQGNLTEALGYLRLGREFNEGIEGPARRGPMGDRLALNYAAVQIERGRVEPAARHIRRLRADAADGSLLALLADGYLCLIDDLRGRTTGVREGFAKAIAGLETLGETRAQALFLLHLARATYRIDPTEGSRLIEKAHSLASAGGHEDLRNRVELSRVAFAWRLGNRPDTDWSRRLIAVETYGQRMGIWSLQVDALRLRAERLLSFGESASAGQLLVRAMAIAQRHRMMLRLNGAITLYARTLLVRGEITAARSMAEDSLKLARRLRYALEENRASSLLMEITARSEVGSLKTDKMPI